MPDRSDDQLLDVLREALVDGPVAAPTMAEVIGVRSIVAEAERAAARSRMSRWRRRVAVLVAGGMVLSGGTAYATSGAAPRPVRSAAFALKLPVEAPDVTDAKKALDDLDEELREGRRDKVAKALVDAEAELGELSPGGRAALEPRASTSLAAARAFLASPAVEARKDDGDPVEAELDEHRTSGTSDDRGSTGSGDDGSGSGDDRRGSGDSGTSGSGTSGGSDDSRSGSGTSDSGSGGSGTSGSGTSGSGSSGSGTSGSGRSGSGSDDGGTSGSGSGGSGSSGSDSVDD